MEMQEISGEVGRKEDEGPSPQRLETKTESSRNLIKSEEVDTDPYSHLQNTTEDVYTDAFYGSSPGKARAGKPAEGNIRLYRAACAFLSLMSLVLLLVIIVLCVKPQTESLVCPERVEKVAEDKRVHSLTPTCSYDQCLAHLPTIQSEHLGCQQCADGWLTLGRSCFYLSTFRLSWEESQRNCSQRGGSLAVITEQQIQDFLTDEGKMKYWIGLKKTANIWTWVGDVVLQKSYWEDSVQDGDCSILNSENPPEKNWQRAPCRAHSYFICHVQF